LDQAGSAWHVGNHQEIALEEMKDYDLPNGFEERTYLNAVRIHRG
jgi:hypothetical protein